MTTRFPFNHARLRKLPPAPQGQRVTYHDTKLPFLKCIVSDTGCKSLVIVAKFRGKTRRRVVHRLWCSELDPSIETLRIKAREVYLSMESVGAAPSRESAPKFREFVEVWADSAEMRSVKPSWKETKLAAVRKHCGPILDKKLDEIGRSDIRRLLTDMNGKYERVASIVRGIVNQVYELAIDDGVLPEDHPLPVPKRLRLKRNKRERRLSQDELSRLWLALVAYKGHGTSDPVSFRLVVLLGLFTAQRRGNILAMRWDELDTKGRIWTVPPEKTKTNREYRVGLHDAVWRALGAQRENLMRRGLSGAWVFPSLIVPDQPLTDVKKPWEWLVTEAGLKDFRFHDLRHTAASIAYEVNQDLKGAQLLLQHADMRTTADRYINTTDTAPQVRASGAIIGALCSAAGIEEDGIDSLLAAEAPATRSTA